MATLTNVHDETNPSVDFTNFIYRKQTKWKIRKIEKFNEIFEIPEIFPLNVSLFENPVISVHHSCPED